MSDTKWTRGPWWIETWDDDSPQNLKDTRLIFSFDYVVSFVAVNSV